MDLSSSESDEEQGAKSKLPPLEIGRADWDPFVANKLGSKNSGVMSKFIIQGCFSPAVKRINPIPRP